VDEIYETVLEIFETAKAEDTSTNKAADRIAENRFLAAAGLSKRGQDEVAT